MSSCVEFCAGIAPAVLFWVPLLVSFLLAVSAIVMSIVDDYRWWSKYQAAKEADA